MASTLLKYRYILKYFEKRRTQDVLDNKYNYNI